MQIDVKIGTEIVLIESLHGFDDAKQKIERKYIVKKVYPFMVLAENENGIKRCFSYGDLVRLGKQMQAGRFEALRKERDELDGRNRW
jgi:hypothetical protein